MSAAAAAAMSGVCATASAQILVEIEGPMSAYVATTGNTGTMTVMNNKIAVDANTVFASPTETRADLFARRLPGGGRELNEAGAVYNVSNWMRGDMFDGRRQRGFIGATVIVTGTVDPVTGVVTAQEVFSDISENVVLGAVYENLCTNAACNDPGNFIRGNGPLGPAFVPNADKRLPALPITDAGLFELNLAFKNLGVSSGIITSFGGEGYFTQDPVPVGDGAEQAIVYYAFELGENRPDLLATPGIPEISTLRVRCTEGSRLEVRGFVHAPTDATGAPTGGAGMPQSGGVGRIRATMTVNGTTLTFLDEDNAPPVADVPATYGVYQLRQDVAACGDSVNVFWDPPGGVGAPWASALNVPVDRLREE